MFPRYAINGEPESACWLDDDTIVVSTNLQDIWDEEEPTDLGPNEIGVRSVSQERWTITAPLQKRAGTLAAFGSNVLGLYEHPKLIDPVSGLVLDEWPEIPSGLQEGSFGIAGSKPRTPAIAVDPDHHRFAVADGTDVLVVDIDIDV